MFPLLFLFFLLVPLVEIYFLIQVGSVIGAGWTVFLVVFTAVLGAYLLRLQGFNTLRRAQSSLAGGQLPAMEMMEGLGLLVSGALLLTPGFVTDTIGFLLLVPAVRQFLIKKSLKQSQVHFSYRQQQSYTHQNQRYSQEDVIEGELVDDDTRHIDK
jgi:UPF0716 protein FxsA